MTPLEPKIIGMISELATIRPENIKPEYRLREDVGLDSVSSMELLSMLSEQLDLDIEIEEAIEVTTVAEVIALAKSKLAKKP